jgi:tRNA(Ile)-lysidine synthase
MSFSAAQLRSLLDLHTPPAATGLVVALSGGADSAALLAAAAGLERSFRGLSLRAVHVDHGLQAASGAFREACSAACAAVQVPLRIIAVSIDAQGGESIEAAARAVRYAAFAADLAPGECLLTAHHRDDQAETLLLQALRGAGLKGLSAMPVCRALGGGWHVRPLLEVSRRELRAYGAAAGAAALADPMNDDLRFDRSYLRALVWPQIEARWPAVGTALSRAAAHAAEAQSLLDEASAAAVGRLRDGEALSLPGLRVLANHERMGALRFWLRQAQVEPPSTARLTEAMRQMLESRTDHLPAIAFGQVALRRYRQRIFLTPAAAPRLEDALAWDRACAPRINLGTGLGEIGWVSQIGGIDASRLPQSLIIRRRRGGETLKPRAGAKTQSVQHLCQSYGVLPWMRDAMPLVFAKDALIAVANLWCDSRWCVAAGAPGLAIDWQGAPNIV